MGTGKDRQSTGRGICVLLFISQRHKNRDSGKAEARRKKKKARLEICDCLSYGEKTVPGPFIRN